MQVLSLNHAAGSLALRSLGEAQTSASLSISRLSSGNRLVRASDDVAALSVSTTLKRNAITLQTAIGNSLQAQSLLEVTDSGLMRIEEQMQRMKALATQAGSGSLTNAERGFLNQEFQNLLLDIERISEQTNFNNVYMLRATQEVRSVNDLLNQGVPATGASATLFFTANPVAATSLLLNGVSVAFGAQVAVGVTIDETVSNLANYLNAQTDARLTAASYEADGRQLIIRSKSAGEMANFFSINEQDSTSNATFFVSGQQLSEDQRWVLDSGKDGTVSRGSVSVSGSALGNLVTGQNIRPNFVTLRQVGGTTNMADGQYLDIDMGDFSPTLGTSLMRFTYRTGSAPLPTDIQIGATYEETMRNTVTVLERYLQTNPPPATYTTYGLRNIQIYRDGDVLRFESNLPGALFDIRGNNLDMTELSNANFSNSNFNNNSGSSVGGVNATNIANNEAFIGVVQGFEASVTAANTVQLTLTVGDHTYRATATTSAVAARVIEMRSQDGGSFQMELAAGGVSVLTTEDAEAYGQMLDTAFQGLRFTQKRTVDIAPVGRMVEARVVIQSDSFTEVDFSSISVGTYDATRNDTAIRITLNGEEYITSQRIGSTIGALENIVFESTIDSSHKIFFTNADMDIDLSTSAGAARFQSELEASLPRHEVNRASFIVGNKGTDTLTIALRSVSLKGLFGETLPDILTQDSARAASDALDSAIASITSRRAEVGSSQSRFEYARLNLENAFRSQTTARAVLSDTDIAAESSAFASAQVRANASIGVLAQANQLGSYMLDLLTQ